MVASPSKREPTVKVGDVVVYYDRRLPRQKTGVSSSMAIIRKVHDADTVTLQLVQPEQLVPFKGTMQVSKTATIRGQVFQNVRRQYRSGDDHQTWSDE